MRKSTLTSERVPSERSTCGFSLLEVLISITFLTVVVVTVLQCMTYCLRVSEEAHKHWREALSNWNEVQELRSRQAGQGDLATVMRSARPMLYQEVPLDGETSDDHWGVLRAPR